MAQTISLERPARRKASVRTVTGPAAPSRARARTSHPGVPGEPAAPTLSTVEPAAGYAAPAAKPQGTVVEAPFTVVNPANGQPLLTLRVDSDGAPILTLFGADGKTVRAELSGADEGGCLALFDPQDELKVLLEAPATGGILQVRSGNPDQPYQPGRSSLAGPLDLLDGRGEPVFRFDTAGPRPAFQFRNPQDGTVRARLALDHPDQTSLNLLGPDGTRFVSLSALGGRDTRGLGEVNLSSSTGLKFSAFAQPDGGGIDLYRDRCITHTWANTPGLWRERLVLRTTPWLAALARFRERLRQSRWVKALTCF